MKEKQVKMCKVKTKMDGFNPKEVSKDKERDCNCTKPLFKERAYL
jgi:hypothetical protein